MQTPPNENNPYYHPQGYGNGIPQVPDPAEYGQQDDAYGYSQPQVSAQPQSGPGVPPPYTLPVQPAGYTQQQDPYAPQQGNYPPQQNPYAPQQGTYPPQQNAYAPQQDPYAQQQPEENEYYQSAYQPQQPVPFQNTQQPYQAPYRKNHLNIILGAIVAVLAVVLGVIAISQMVKRQPASTARVMAGTLGSVYTGDALIVRNEVTYTQEGVSQIDYTATEGTMVRRGDKVCTVYTAGFNSREWTTLNNYRTQIKEYQKTLLAETNIETDSQLKRLNSAVLTRAAETQAMVQSGAGNLINQETLMKNDLQERAYYLRQKYSDDQKLSRLYDDEKTQLQRIETWTTPFAAGDTGIVSFYNDGFERVLNLQTYENFSPTEVRKMYEGTLPAGAELGRNEVSVYRIVRQGSYAVLMLCNDTSWTPTVGASYELLVESFDNTNVSATVESVTRAENMLLVRLSVKADVSPILYIRACHVQLSESIYSLTVPANALTTDEGQIGVVVVQPDGNYFLPVTVISQDAREAHIVPLLSNILGEGSVVLLF